MSIEPVELFYKEYGDGPPLIILHGLLGAGGNWHTLSRNFFAKDFTVYAVDLRNHGRSPHSPQFDFPTMVADVERFYEARGLRDACVMGHSMGGKVAMHLALSASGLVSKLIVADIAPKAYPPTNQEILDALRAVDLSTAETRSDVDEALARYIKSKPVRQFLLKNLAYDSETERYSWQMGLEEINDNYSRLNEPVESERSYAGPALFLRGERSNYIEDEDFDAIKNLFPSARIDTIPNAGHWIHSDAPELVAERVIDFLFE